MELKGPRWKGKDAAAIAHSNPMSEIVAQLQSSLRQSKAQAFLSGSDLLLAVDDEERNLLSRASFGNAIDTADKNKQLFQLDFEEAFYLAHSLECLLMVGQDKQPMSCEELWGFVKSKNRFFPYIYKAYLHLRKKNWVVRSGSSYGTDFVAYCHHPSLVHSSYTVVVLNARNVPDSDEDARLRIWSNWEGMVRLSGSVAKTLLLIYINDNRVDATHPSCLESYTVEERTITRWNPDRCREDRERENK